MTSIHHKFYRFFFRLWHWETWHYLAKYIPIMPVWAWYIIRARSLWFFTPSNPTIDFGGFEGESKSQIYEQLPPGSFPATIRIEPASSIQEVELLRDRHQFGYPFIVKPDAGMMGLMFRKIDHPDQLAEYHRVIGCPYLMQAYVSYPVEVSIFYYRHPTQSRGTISGFLRKEFLEVIGDGASTLRKLIMTYDRVRFRIPEMLAKHANRLEEILPAGTVFQLSPALNLSRGGRLVSLAHEIDERLHHMMGNLTRSCPHFYYGRYDIKCASIEDLKAGVNFQILEYNGCGAEPHHAYGNGNTLLQAYAIFLAHWKILYRISAYNHRHGFPRWNFKKGMDYLKRGKANFRRLRKLDSETPV